MLLAEEAVARIARTDAFADRRLGGAVGHRHRVVASGAVLVLDVKRRAEVRQRDLAGGLRGLPRELQGGIDVEHGAPRYFAFAAPRMSTPVSFCCASISDGTNLSPKPSVFAMTRLWCVASPMIDGSIIDSAKCV